MVKRTIKAKKAKALKIVDKIYETLVTREQKLCMDDVSVQIELEDYLEACVGLNKMGLRKTAEEVATLLGVKSAYLARKEVKI